MYVVLPDVVSFIQCIWFVVDFLAVKADRLEMMDILLNLCTYRHPENIALPKGYHTA